MKIINKTPHRVIYDPEIKGEDNHIFDPVGEPARLKTTSRNSNLGIFQTVIRETNIINLPEEKEGIYYIVSNLVFNLGISKNRKDLLIPENKNKKGNDTISCRRFRQTT